MKKVKEHLSCALMNTALDVFFLSLSLTSYLASPLRHTDPRVIWLIDSPYVAIRFRNIYFVPMSSPRETCPKNANVLFTSGVEKKQ